MGVEVASVSTCIIGACPAPHHVAELGAAPIIGWAPTSQRSSLTISSTTTYTVPLALRYVDLRAHLDLLAIPYTQSYGSD